MDRGHPQMLATFVAGVAGWQLMIYAGPFIGVNIPFYFDPRIGLNFFGSVLHIHIAAIVLQFLSAFSLAALAVAMLYRRGAVLVYAVLEPIMALPTIAFMIIVLWVNIGPAHGFSIPELIVPAAVFVVCTLTPWVWAVAVLRAGRE